jgi:multiple sugar transport system ATP-binding protein
MAVVGLSHVTKRFADFTAVKDISLEIADGSFTVLVGPSGCGKTTTLRMVAGLDFPSEGQITIGSRVVNSIPPKDRDIAMVFQNYALYPHMNVFRNMAFGLTLRKMPKTEIENRVHRAAALLGIEDKLNQKPKELSGGQRQRVALGRAIVLNPEVFLFDEPLSNLDAKLRVQTRIELKELHRELKTTTLYVTHDQVEAMTLGDKVAVMKDGQIQQYGTSREIYRTPVNMFVAGFIGSPSMNFLPAKVKRDEHHWQFQSEAFHFHLPLDRSGRLPHNVMVGIRPEDLKVSPQEGGIDIPLRVSLIEHVGNALIVHGRCGDTPMVASLDPDLDVTPDSRLALTVNPQAAHVFDPETEQRLTDNHNG